MKTLARVSPKSLNQRDTSLADPFEAWKRMRGERYAKYRPVGYAIIAASFAFFVHVARRIRSLWVGERLGQIFILLLAQLTSSSRRAAPR